MTDDSKKEDLSSLITQPETASSPLAKEAEHESPIEFESLEELSQKFNPPQELAEPTGENAVSGKDMSRVDVAPELQADAQAQTQPSAIQAPLDSIKSYSENLAPAPQIPCAFPFTLRIDGKLPPEDAEKLTTVLTRENMGFREVDLEPQLAEGKILIPRISEYAGILLIQALRGISARIQFGPSDVLEARATDTPASWTDQDEEVSSAAVDFDIPVANSDRLPQFQQIRVIDTVIVSGLLSTKSVEAENSEEYTQLVEALIRELKFKARRRGANGIISLQITLTPLTLPTDYRLSVSGSAVAGTP